MGDRRQDRGSQLVNLDELGCLRGLAGEGAAAHRERQLCGERDEHPPGLGRELRTLQYEHAPLPEIQ